MMVVTLGALSRIPKELYEAAAVDGATRWQRLRHVVLPLLRPALLPSVILGAVWTFNMFNIVFLVSRRRARRRHRHPGVAGVPLGVHARPPLRLRGRVRGAHLRHPGGADAARAARRRPRDGAPHERALRYARSACTSTLVVAMRGHALPGAVGGQDGAVAVAGLRAVAVAVPTPRHACRTSSTCVSTHDAAGRWLFGRQLVQLGGRRRGGDRARRRARLLGGVRAVALPLPRAADEPARLPRVADVPRRRHARSRSTCCSIGCTCSTASRGLVLVYATTAIPFCVFMLKGYFDTLPRELEEAVLLDGGTRFDAFWRVALPLARPALAVTALFSLSDRVERVHPRLHVHERSARLDPAGGAAALRRRLLDRVGPLRRRRHRGRRCR